MRLGLLILPANSQRVLTERVGTTQLDLCQCTLTKMATSLGDTGYSFGTKDHLQKMLKRRPNIKHYDKHLAIYLSRKECL